MRIICLLIGYLFGSFLTAEVVTKAKGLDVREVDPEAEHRGNPGVANVAINVGYKYGILVLIGDALKVLLAFLITYYIYEDRLIFLYTGFGALLGHDFSFLYKFNGGKGVLVTIVWLFTLLPFYYWLIVLFLSALTIKLTHHLNTGSFALPIVATIFCFISCGIEAGIIMFIVVIITYFRNRRDLIGIIKGEFSSFSISKITDQIGKKK